MAEEDRNIAEAARRHGLSEGATQALWRALVAGHGTQAQFSHPDLGGMGQWSGGMVQIGDMFNATLKAKVAAACADLAASAARAPASRPVSGSHQSQYQGDGARSEAAAFASGGQAWWPENLGAPSSTGAQNDIRYALFPDRHRLAIRRHGTITLYDTGEHRISGFSQQQGTCSALAFTSQFGAVMLDALPIVGE